MAKTTSEQRKMMRASDDPMIHCLLDDLAEVEKRNGQLEEEIESWMTTVEVLENPELMEQLRSYNEAKANGTLNTYSMEEVKQMLKIRSQCQESKLKRRVPQDPNGKGR